MPEPEAGEVRVRVRACGACRTDLHVAEGELAQLRSPLIPGHQVVGTVDSLGRAATRFGIGDRIGIAWLRSTCGRCRFCLASRENLCERSTYTGWTHDGGYAEYACVPEAFAYAMPSMFDDAEATPLLCAGIIGYRALRRSQVPRGGRLGLYGFGSSAHITLQVARHWGCAVYVATREPDRQRLALELGASWAGAPGDTLPVKLDAAIVFGPGLRWAFMGTFLAFHLAGGDGGMRHMLEQFGPALKLPWTKLRAPELTPQLARRMVRGTTAQANGRSIKQLERWRDDQLIRIMSVTGA